MKFKDFRLLVYIGDTIDIYIKNKHADTIETDVTKYDDLRVDLISHNQETGHLEAYLF